MKLSKLQEYTYEERKRVILKFQRLYKTKKAKEQALNIMSNSDINFLIYCMDNIHGKIYYSKFLKEEK